jgi:hypothetical protein
MAATFTWSITSLDCLPQSPEGPDYVVNANWRCDAAQDGYSTFFLGNCSFPVVQGESFVPYAQLTQQLVLDWCWNSGISKDEVEATLQIQINNYLNPPIITPPLPWG